MKNKKSNLLKVGSTPSEGESKFGSTPSEGESKFQINEVF
jgi:hypothetical protein